MGYKLTPSKISIPSYFGGYHLIFQWTITCLFFIIKVSPEVCEPRILDYIPPDPSYDVATVTTEAALELTKYLSTKSSEITLDEMKIKVNEIANKALQDDRDLLAIALATPSIKLAVVQFRDHIDAIGVGGGGSDEGSGAGSNEGVTNVATNHSFLSIYWHELGEAWNSSSGTKFWGAPFRDCGPLPGRWLWPFRVIIEDYGYKTIAISFIAADDDHCNTALSPIFGKNHSCDLDTTYCIKSIRNDTTTLHPQHHQYHHHHHGSYVCLCRYGFYLPNQHLQGFSGDQIELGNGNGNFSCLPCPNNCHGCDVNGICSSDVSDQERQEHLSIQTLLYAVIAIILGTCMLCCIVLSIIVFKQRKCKTISSGMWTVLETILLGIFLLYSAVALHFFPASTVRCLLEPWYRELGFVICYGAIILKLYRHLVEFRTRKAHRWVLRDVDLLKYLSTMIFAVICYMAAFTASSIDLIQYAIQFDGLKADNRADMCRPLKWEMVTQASEIIILVFGVHLAIASRNANTQFKERQFLVASIILELIVSSIFYLLRWIYVSEFNPNVIFLALFIRSQLTNTITIGLIFIPKLWYQNKQGSHETSHHAGYAGICLGDPDSGELTISEMNPEDVRAELKRLYTQLEVLKNKTIRQDNPHISKRRGGRKTHRRFSLQKKGSKEKALNSKNRSNRQNIHEVEITEAEASRTPEDSVCSIEGGEISGVSISK